MVTLLYYIQFFGVGAAQGLLLCVPNNISEGFRTRSFPFIWSSAHFHVFTTTIFMLGLVKLCWHAYLDGAPPLTFIASIFFVYALAYIIA